MAKYHPWYIHLFPAMASRMTAVIEPFFNDSLVSSMVVMSELVHSLRRNSSKLLILFDASTSERLIF